MAGSPANLTRAQKEVLRLYNRRFSAGEIATELGLTTTAVTERLRSARAKLDVSSSAEAARLLSEYEQLRVSDQVPNRQDDPAAEASPPEPSGITHQSDVDMKTVVSIGQEMPPPVRLPRLITWQTKGRKKSDLSLVESFLLVIAMTAVLLTVVALYLLGVKALSSLV